MKYLDKLKKALDDLEVIYSGCSKEEIEKISSNIGRPLPACYREYLELMGKSMDRKSIGKRGFLVGNAAFYENIEENNGNNGLKGLLIEDSSQLVLPATAFIFYGSQGILYAFFNTDEGGNPPIYGYEEGFEGNEFPKISDSLSQFFEDYLEGKNVFSKLM